MSLIARALTYTARVIVIAATRVEMMFTTHRAVLLPVSSPAQIVK